MLLKNAKIYSEGLVHNGAILITNGCIKEIKFDPDHKDYRILAKKNKDDKEIDCKNKLILPGIIDIHSHLRDMGQSEKETFLTGSKAAAYSGITTVFNMPNTKPPAITGENVQKWMEKASTHIYVNVGFIAGVPDEINEDEIKKILSLGVIGFKIYPLNPLNDIDWNNPDNIHKILKISSKYQIPIFFHAAFPISESEKAEILNRFEAQKYPILELHDQLNPIKMERKYIEFIIEIYQEHIIKNKLNPLNYPHVHFCHVSCIEGYKTIQDALISDKNLKITFEITPHHLILSYEIKIKRDTYGKVLPPLRSSDNRTFLFNQLTEGNVPLIGTDHAPHTIKEKNQDYFNAPSGFPGFETYPLILLHSVFNFKLSLENFVKCSSENPARMFNLKNKGFIKEGYDADLLIVDKRPQFSINSKNFKTKAKFSPFENHYSVVQIWKVFLMGNEINNENINPVGNIIKASYKI
ncbi:MAG: dihydroorotase family protein [Candidatus Hermodarchaeota archaeon]